MNNVQGQAALLAATQRQGLQELWHPWCCMLRYAPTLLDASAVRYCADAGRSGSVESNPLVHNGDIHAKVIGNAYPGPDHRQNLITSRGSPLAYAYYVWSTSVSTFVIYPAHRHIGRQTDRQTERTITFSARLGGVKCK